MGPAWGKGLRTKEATGGTEEVPELSLTLSQCRSLSVVCKEHVLCRHTMHAHGHAHIHTRTHIHTYIGGVILNSGPSFRDRYMLTLCAVI